ncbi:hypothetical protein [Evansella halocellulosilytica]|uniref:hypothetical protein n=1 Tax=Evansella halocellulosilytica TaxID=2011013 RepID=UPI000BB814D8|nr:hypothetical protein [Evansella halocellulosilytica]
MDWFIRLILILLFLPFIFYFMALGKNVRETEKKHNRDMTYELNPFTGTKMPVESHDEGRKNSSRCGKSLGK